MFILVTGGAGYIGSHTVLELLETGHKVVVLDNLVNGSYESIRRIEKISGKSVPFVEGDVRDRDLLSKIFLNYQIEAVIHFAGLKAVGESVVTPLAYYDANVVGSLVLCQAMADAGVYSLVFSSSATVYGPHAPVPYVEDMPRAWTTSPYGNSKSIVEQMLEELSQSDPRWRIVLLRYFNPVGAHPTGLIGEDPRGVPNNLMPFISQVAIGRIPELTIYGNNYPTKDGTCIRDYIHVMDLASGHVLSLKALRNGVNTYNLGTGEGISVLQLVKTFENITGQSVPYRFGPRREGDLAAFWADPSQAQRKLGWCSGRGIEEMVKDTWRWQKNNPNGYDAS
ncbi:UDP-glucose 4-epimerase GalE [Billgrantia pellis]|uniref:UDP-glucose 4-epimerase n=1 Tax=Billgrantia pellis TaxID=2606936 RepID=A0A7V7KHT0_9GAMM|nr:UDP-glucose 4-epimerase GalE [Halomonas pellis]KAA0014612.1 UDP-glucose 4-epimerase GalE [Halomonas pellis]